ncbi:unnamed protein product [Microthlaspi erraticum]|uniref:Uncharacterized protein n=1 Tax=Microthlaspi erraticum TaxID=1685480 RepID=A0A6D2JAJ2_9BRAS|nr:unnamed protein product [Microthlaspi erraticum]
MIRKGFVYCVVVLWRHRIICFLNVLSLRRSGVGLRTISVFLRRLWSGLGYYFGLMLLLSWLPPSLLCYKVDKERFTRFGRREIEGFMMDLLFLMGKSSVLFSAVRKINVELCLP